MNKLIRVGCLAAAMAFASLCTAQTNAEEHASHHPEAAQSASKESPNTADPAVRMEENAKRMQDLMAKIHTEKNRKEREKLMREHTAAMREQMNTMREMKMPSTQKSDGGGMMNHDMMARHQMMQMRQDMMQMMMDQMLQHQEMQETTPPQRP